MRGGTLEPLQKVPAFKYTQSSQRKIWTSAMYPYAPYFFSLLNEIPWSSYVYETDNFIARCNKDAYRIVGGSACEVLHKEYQKVPGYTIDLYKYVDPTGDIDIEILPLFVVKKAGYDDVNHPFEILKHFSRWLVFKTADFFRKLSYNFPTWFSDTVDFDIMSDIETKHSDITLAVNPFKLCRLLIPHEDYTGIKIQAVMAIHDSETDEDILDHLLEFVFWNTVTYDNVIYTNEIIHTSLGLNVRGFAEEFDGNLKSLVERHRYKDNKKYMHKVYNHIYRQIYLMKLALFICQTMPIELFKKISEDYLTSVYTLYNNFSDNKNARIMIDSIDILDVHYTDISIVTPKISYFFKHLESLSNIVPNPPVIQQPSSKRYKPSGKYGGSRRHRSKKGRRKSRRRL